MIRKVDPLVSLPAADVDRAVAFYTRMLGLKTLFEEPVGGFYIFQGEEGGTLIGLHRYEGSPPEPDPRGVWIWLQVDDIAAASKQLIGQGVRFLEEKTYIGPGYQAIFLDSEGNVLRLYQPLQEVRRGVQIQAPPRFVFAALTDVRAIAKWFTTIRSVELDARLNGRIAFIDPLFGEVEGRVVEFIPEKRVVFEFARNWPTRLEFNLTEEEATTRVEVFQTGFDAIRDRDFNIGSLVANVEVALEALAKHIQRASKP